MSATPTRTASGSSTRRRRPAEFLLPDGKKVLVALPEEAPTLRQKYSRVAGEGQVSTDGGGDGTQVEVVVHGSEEHRHLLLQSQMHHERRREELRARHGADFDEWETVHAQLDSVSLQLERLTDHSTMLHANFSKFGYDARLRTYSEEDSEGGSGSGSGLASSRSSMLDASEKIDWFERRGGDTIKLFKKPVIKQYFHRGLLWRASAETEVQSFELFFDLLYVGIIAINGDRAAEGADGPELLRFVITFCMSWKIWSEVAQLVSWFETDDILQRVEILFLIACLLGLTTNMLQTFDDTYDTYNQLVAFYIAARLFVAAYCALTGFLLPLVKGSMISMVVIMLVGVALWIGSTQMEMPHRLAFIFVALVIDLFGGSFIVFFYRYSRSHDDKLGRRLSRFYEFYPAINIEHKVERTNAFVTLVLGYSVVGVIYQNAAFGLNAFLGKAILGLVQAFIFNWLYFEVDGHNIHAHAIRRHVFTAFLWQYAHLMFIMSFILAAAALSRLVLVTDCADAPAETLTDQYLARSAPEIALGLRFYYCIGLAASLAAMGLVSISHDHKLPLACRLPKRVRLGNRFAVCAVLSCLPAAQSLNSLSLVSIATGLTLWVLLVEIWGKSCPDQTFFGEDCQRRGYTARCSKRELEEAMRNDGEVDVMELGKNENTAVPDLN